MIYLLLLGIASAMTANQVDILDKLKNSHYDILLDTLIHSVEKQKNFDLSGCIDKKVGIHGAKDLTADAVQAMKKLGFSDVRDLENLDWAKLEIEGSQLVKGLENDVLSCAKPKSSAQMTTEEPKRCCKERSPKCFKCWKEFCKKNPKSPECSKRTREPKPFSSGEPKRCCKEMSPKCFKCWKEFCKKNPKSPECSKRTREPKPFSSGEPKRCCKERSPKCFKCWKEFCKKNPKSPECSKRTGEPKKHGKDGKKSAIEALKKLWEEKHGDRKKFYMEALKKLWEQKEGKEGKKFDEESMKKLWAEMTEKKEKRGDKKNSADSWDKTNKEDWESKKKDFEKHGKGGQDKKRDWEKKDKSGKGEKKDGKRGKDHGKGEKHGKGHSKEGKHGKGKGKHGKGHGKEGKHGKDHGKKGKHGKEGEKPETESMQKEQSVNSESVEFNARHGKHHKNHKNGITHSKYFLPAVIGGSVLVAGLLCCLGRYCYNRKKVVSTVPTYPQEQVAEGTYVMDVETMGNETGGDTFAPVYQP